MVHISVDDDFHKQIAMTNEKSSTSEESQLDWAIESHTLSIQNCVLFGMDILNLC